MQTVIRSRTEFQVKVVADVLPEATFIPDEPDAIVFPYGPVDAIAAIRKSRENLKGTGPNNALNAVLKALDKGKDVEVIVAEGEEAPKKASAKRAKKAVKTTADGLCLCGCGEKVVREFRPGHDARYKGQLIKTVLTSEVDSEVDAALEVINERRWNAFLDKSRDAAEKKAAKKAANPNSNKRGKVAHDGPTVNLKQLGVARDMLKKIGRYGESAGDRQIPLTPEAIPLVISGDHCDLTDADLAELSIERPV